MSTGLSHTNRLSLDAAGASLEADDSFADWLEQASVIAAQSISKPRLRTRELYQPDSPLSARLSLGLRDLKPILTGQQHRSPDAQTWRICFHDFLNGFDSFGGRLRADNQALQRSGRQ